MSVYDQIEELQNTLLTIEQKKKEITKLILIVLFCDWDKLPISYLVRLNKLLDDY